MVPVVRGIDDVSKALAPLLARHKLCVLPRVLERTCTERQGAKDTLLISVSLYALGLAMASLVRSANAARAVSFAVFFPMMFLSGTLPAISTRCHAPGCRPPDLQR
jgi:hypothetical protein